MTRYLDVNIWRFGGRGEFYSEQVDRATYHSRWRYSDIKRRPFQGKRKKPWIFPP